MKLDQPPYETMNCINAAIAQAMELCPQPELVSWGRRWISPHAPAACAGGGPRAGDFQDIALFERLGLQERGGERDQLVAVRGEQAGRFPLAFLDDAPHLGVDQLGGRLAVGLALESGRGPVVLRGNEADRAELLAHSPAQYHLAGDLGEPPGGVRAARRAGALDALLGP